MQVQNKRILDWRDVLLTSLILLSFISLLFIKPIPQDLAYHIFADRRTIAGINNFFDVLSNLPFFYVGLLGVVSIKKHWGVDSSMSWLILFLSVLFVSIGSSYYHLNPENQTLTWDRLPMAIGFMALFVVTITDYVHPQLEKWLLLPMCLLGIISVGYWHFTDDLRFYAWVQFVSIALLVLIISMYKPTHLRTKYILYAILFYTLSKIAEYYDQSIFKLTSFYFSGHTIKHLLAAAATYCFYLLLIHRVP